MSVHALELEDPTQYLSRQLSWLAFDRRVLELARDPDLPALERVRHLAIAGSNLDGFFMKRVGALKRQVELGVARVGPSPLAAAEELDAVRVAVHALMRDQEEALDEILADLARHGVRLVDYAALTDDQRQALSRFFELELLPVLTPLAVDPGRPFPFISNLSLSLAVLLRHEQDAPLFARVKVPANRPRWVRLPGDLAFVPSEQVIGHHLERLFRNMTIMDWKPFRLTRSADVPRDEAAADDLMDFAVDLVRERRFAPVVRLELDAGMPADVRELLIEELAIEPVDVYDADGLLGHSDLLGLAELDLPELKWPVWQPQPNLRFPALDEPLQPAQLFRSIRDRDILVHHPYHDYDQTVVAFLSAAADDPQVLAIKQSLYRTARESPTIEALLRAAENGKEVTALVELKARLDEAGNIAWAQRLEQAGIHTSYGFVGFKTHTRMTLVVREEPDGLRTYVHFSTGDYNHVTARGWTDVGLFTARPEVGADARELFNFLTGYSDVPATRAMIVAPTDMRTRLIEHIEGEIAHAQLGRAGRVIAMMNAFADVPLTDALVRASGAGVRVDLIVRGECCVRPGIAGMSENIHVRSVLGPFLEHARLFHFANGGDSVVYIGSADWMYRNLDHRVEGALPVDDEAARAQLEQVLTWLLEDTAFAWELQSDGSWQRVRPAPGEAPVSAQRRLMEWAMAQGTQTSTSSPSTLTS